VAISSIFLPNNERNRQRIHHCLRARDITHVGIIVRFQLVSFDAEAGANTQDGAHDKDAAAAWFYLSS
jgi:hypothetical protein